MIKNIHNSFSSKDATTFVELVPNMIYVGLYSGIIFFLESYIFKFDLALTPMVFSLLGVVLGLLLVFRTNTAYERWWEGRRIWGGMVDASRNMAIKLDSYLPESDNDTRAFFAMMIPNYFFALKEHMREGVKLNELEEVYKSFYGELASKDHIPNYISGKLFGGINKLASDKVITQEQLLTLDKLADVFTQAAGGCERIKNTPIPASYSKHLDRFVLIFSLLLPFGFMHDLGWWSIPVVMLVYFALEGIKTIGEEIEDPFGNDANDLPLDSISNRIRLNIKEILIK